MQINEINALIFDVFGTVVDWRMSIAREGKALARRKDISHVDWLEFADEWRAGYGPSMNRVRQGELPWTRIDDLHRMILDELLIKYGIEGLTEDEKCDFNKAWHRLDPWPDSPPGLTRLKQRYIIATLSNGYLLKGGGPLILIVPAMPCSSWPSLWQYSFRFLPFVMG